MAVSASGRRTRRGYAIEPGLFRLWMARRGLHFAALRHRYGFPTSTLTALMNGRPVDASTIRRLDEIGRQEPVLEIAHELFPLSGGASIGTELGEPEALK